MHDFIRQILYLFSKGLFLAIAAVLIYAVVLVVIGCIFRKKNRPFPWKKSIVSFFLVGWLVLTAFVTIWKGQPGVRQCNFHLFLAWREAWNQFSLRTWLNVLLNIALFSPLGILLPLLAQSFKKWYVTLSVSFGVSLTIETIQLITKRGIFDVDDLLLNTLGAMVGWSVSLLILSIVSRNPGWKRRCVGYSSVPVLLSLTLLSLVTIYALKPYGNLPDAPAHSANLSDIQWELAFTPEDTPTTTQVYQANRFDRASSNTFGSDFAKKIGIEFLDIYYYDDLMIFANHSTGDFLHLNQRDGTWSYQPGRESTPVFPTSASDITAEALSAVLERWEIAVAENTHFSIEPYGNAHYKASFTAEFIPAGNTVLYGTLICDLQEENGTTKLEKIENQLVPLTPCKEERILSPAQAVEALYSGHSFEGTLLEHYGITQVKVLSCKLDWMDDTKGFYQPVYRFELQLPQQETITDFVSALQ